MMLHVVNKSPFEKSSLASCLRVSAEGASILLIEDGVYGALKGTQMESDMSAAMPQKNIYALGPDLKARGIELTALIEGVEVVDYEGFVTLAAQTKNTQSWL